MSESTDATATVPAPESTPATVPETTVTTAADAVVTEDEARQLAGHVASRHRRNRSESITMQYNIRIVAGNGNPELAERVASTLGIRLEPCNVSSFADGELHIKIQNNVRGSDMFIIQPTVPDVNKNLMELLLLIHTLKLSSAKRITAIVPYFGYARQDRKTEPRVPISASAVAQLIEAMGPERLVTVDLHCGQIQGFFHRTPVDNLFAENEFIRYIKSKGFPTEKMVIVSPDAGGVQRARRVADRLRVESVVTILKRRSHANQVDAMQIVGDVSDAICFIVDDIIDTAGTLTKAAALLKDNGAAKVFACASHGVFSGPAIQRMNDSLLEEIAVTDSIPQAENAKNCKKLVIMSIVNLIAEAIERLHSEKSLSVLFQPE